MQIHNDTGSCTLAVALPSPSADVVLLGGKPRFPQFPKGRCNLLILILSYITNGSNSIGAAGSEHA